MDLSSLWLGLESIETTHLYVEADLQMKRETLKRIERTTSAPARFQPRDRLLAFLEAL